MPEPRWMRCVRSIASGYVGRRKKRSVSVKCRWLRSWRLCERRSRSTCSTNDSWPCSGCRKRSVKCKCGSSSRSKCTYVAQCPAKCPECPPWPWFRAIRDHRCLRFSLLTPECLDPFQCHLTDTNHTECLSSIHRILCPIRQSVSHPNRFRALRLRFLDLTEPIRATSIRKCLIRK